MWKFKEPKDVRDLSAAFDNPYFHYLGKTLDGFDLLQIMLTKKPIARKEIAVQSLSILDYIFQVAFREGYPRDTITNASYARFQEKLSVLHQMNAFSWVHHKTFMNVPDYKCLEARYNWYLANSRVGVCMTMGKEISEYPLDKTTYQYVVLYEENKYNLK